MAVISLLIHDVLEVIQYAQAILDFTMLAQYVSHDKETLHYMEHVLYRLEKTKKHLNNTSLSTPNYVDQLLTTLSSI